MGSALGAVGSIFGAASSAKGAAAQAQSQKEAAELQTKVARELHDHWKTYYLSCDVAAIQEVCAEPEVTPNYGLIASRTSGEAGRNFSRAKSQVMADGGIFCLGDTCQSCNYLSSIEALTNADVANFGYRWEEQYTLQYNQIVLENKMMHLAIGRNLLDQQGAATKLATEISQRVGEMAGKAAQNWATLGSYLLSDRGQKQVNDTIGLFKRGFGVTGAEKTENAAYETPDVNAPAEPAAGANQAPDMSGTVEGGDVWQGNEEF